MNVYASRPWIKLYDAESPCDIDMKLTSAGDYP
jgi:hypothetical protein